MKFEIDYSLLDSSSSIVKFIQSASNYDLLKTFELGFQSHKKTEELSVDNIIQDSLLQQSTRLEKNTQINSDNLRREINTQLQNNKELYDSSQRTITEQLHNLSHIISTISTKPDTSSQLQNVVIGIAQKINQMQQNTNINIEKITHQMQQNVNANMEKITHQIESINDNKIQDEVRSLRDHIDQFGKNQSSQHKGVEGELIVQNKLVQIFPDAHIEDVRSVGHKGDFIFSRPCTDIRILIEVKNYRSKNIPTSEIQKFERDLENYDAGILISLYSGIVGYAEVSEKIHDNKVAVYLPNSDDACCGMYFAILSIERFTRYINIKKQSTNITDDERQGPTTDEIFRSVIRALKPIKKSIEFHEGMYNDMTKSQSKITTELNKMIIDMKDGLDQNYKAIDLTINNIVASYKNKELVSGLNNSDLALYEMKDEEVNTEVGTFVIKYLESLLQVYEKSTNILIKEYKHHKTERSMQTAYKRCKDLIKSIEHDKKYKISKTKLRPGYTFIPVAISGSDDENPESV